MDSRPALKWEFESFNLLTQDSGSGSHSVSARSRSLSRRKPQRAQRVGRGLRINFMRRAGKNARWHLSRWLKKRRRMDGLLGVARSKLVWLVTPSTENRQRHLAGGMFKSSLAISLTARHQKETVINFSIKSKIDCWRRSRRRRESSSLSLTLWLMKLQKEHHYLSRAPRALHQKFITAVNLNYSHLAERRRLTLRFFYISSVSFSYTSHQSCSRRDAPIAFSCQMLRCMWRRRY